MLLAKIHYKNQKIAFACSAMSMIDGPGRCQESPGSLKTFSLNALSYSRELLKTQSTKKKYVQKSNRPKEWGQHISCMKKGRSYGTPVKDPNGVIYRTLSECSKKYNVCAETIKFWATEVPNSGFSLVDPDTVDKLSTFHKSKRVQCPDGTVYDSITKCAEALLLDRHTLSRWIKTQPDKGYKFVN